MNVKNTLHWLLAGIRANHGAGSSAWYHVFKGWAPPYPETTGYIIPTLLAYHEHTGEAELLQAAATCAGWLLEIQNEDGSFPAGLGGKGEPIVFDTAMILFGLTAIYHKTGNPAFPGAIQRTVSWVLAQLNPDGGWTRHAFVPGYEPAYYTMVVWAMLYSNQVAKHPGLEQEMAKTLHRYAGWINPDSTVQNWAFRPGEQAFTHTIAYTWQGFLECALVLNDAFLLEKCAVAGRKLMELYKKHGRLAGRYNERWQGDYSFKCLTGQAQLAFFLGRLSGITGEKEFRNTALQLLADLEKHVATLPIPGIKGGVAGSAPVWGPYQRFRYPNWAAKFYLDAALLLV